MTDTLKELVLELERYGFTCEAGKLSNAQPWKKLRAMVGLDLIDFGETPLDNHPTGQVQVWAVYCKSDEYSLPIRLPGYAGSISEVRKQVMDGARREGFTGSFEERMAELGWWLEPLFLGHQARARILGVDVAKDGSEVTVYGHVKNRIVYIDRVVETPAAGSHLDVVAGSACKAALPTWPKPTPEKK